MATSSNTITSNVTILYIIIRYIINNFHYYTDYVIYLIRH
jgi:hypothetical protein